MDKLLNKILEKLEPTIGVDQDEDLSLVFCTNNNLVKPIINWLNMHNIRAERWGGYDSNDNCIWVDQDFVVRVGLDYNDYMRRGV